MPLSIFFLGFCCVEYTPCAEDSETAFTLDTVEEDPIAFNEEKCEGDHIRIEGGMATCSVVRAILKSF